MRLLRPRANEQVRRAPQRRHDEKINLVIAELARHRAAEVTNSPRPPLPASH